MIRLTLEEKSRSLLLEIPKIFKSERGSFLPDARIHSQFDGFLRHIADHVHKRLSLHSSDTSPAS
jgi:hypothetical protein